MTNEEMTHMHEAFRANLTTYINQWLESVNDRRPSFEEWQTMIKAAFGTVDEVSEFFVSQLGATKTSTN